MSYFSRLFHFNYTPAYNLTSDPGLRDCMNMISPRISDDDNSMLTASYTDAEVTRALFSLGPHMSPGHYGFSANFLHKTWDIVKSDFLSDALQFFNHGNLHPEY